MRDELVEAVLARLAVERPTPDLAGLRSIYASWCRSVPFDNTLKLIHTVEGLPGPLPGSTADSFFGEWLEHGTGGTCWAGNGALHDFLATLGFAVERALATMLPRLDLQGPNHGSVIVTIDASRYIADASILSGMPIEILEPGSEDTHALLPRLAWIDDKPAVMWRMLAAPDGFPCRIDRIGASWEEWDALHQRTSGWSPFNYELNIRLQRGTESIGASSGQRFVFQEDGSLAASPLVGSDRRRFLVEDIGISETVARRVPLDRPIPPRPT